MIQKAKFVAILMLLIATVLLVGTCQRQKPVFLTEDNLVFCVDSVWSKSPGEINSLQIDRIYFGRTSDGVIHSSRSEISVGDSFVYICRRAR